MISLLLANLYLDGLDNAVNAGEQMIDEGETYAVIGLRPFIPSGSSYSTHTNFQK